MKKLAMMAFLAAAPAQADVIFRTNAEAEPGVHLTAQVTISDEAFAGGINVHRAYDSHRVHDLQANQLDGLLGLDFTLSREDSVPFRTYTLGHFLETSPNPVIPYSNLIRVVSAPSGLPEVQVSLLNFQDLFRFSFDAASSAGTFATDAPSMCFQQPNTTCQFAGTSPLVVAVPAPAPLGIFGVALLGLALLRRRLLGSGPAATAGA